MIETLAREIRSFIVERFLYGSADTRLPDDASLVEQSVIDSTGVLEIVAFLEERYGIEVGDAEVIPDNLGSIIRIARFVQSKSG
jgi:acyl carrier protein